MIKKICDSCKRQIKGYFVTVSEGHFSNSKEFCSKCQKSAADYLKSLFNKLSEGIIDKK